MTQLITKLKAYNLKLITTGVVLLLVISHLLSVAGAQSPAQVILTWQANNFYPADYAGKALATPNTPVTVSAEVLRDGKLLDTSESTFTWYVDEKLLDRQLGLKEILFTVKKSVSDSHFVRVVIQLEEGVSETSVRIPVFKQLVIIESPYPNQLVEAGSRALFQAIPYFFNISSLQDLEFSWQVNEQELGSGSDNQLILNIGVPQEPNQNTIQVTSLVQNKNDLLEFSSERVRLTIY